eukprot:CAMPEP_0170066496 /NCGR_PEP_ID=MMETSP0019_2-20121128/6173_1 /TAXON_ID=98059 /ORGANISM="Dinobryon sp., Strain UTEXLB2267" /LENGTH=290 /DNA_ID=CAMNT_0010273603 /DNA_START=155 /DNA_END=1027 /DNA_ORIENTATION=-
MMMVMQPWTVIRNSRFCHFNTSMDSLVKYWLPWNDYPVILMLEKPWDEKDKHEILRLWPKLKIHFINVEPQFFIPPTTSTFEDAKYPLSGDDYKRMIAFTFHGFTHVPYLKRYRYLMRMDDDSCILNPIQFDIFQRMQQQNYTYAYKQIFRDPEWAVKGLNDFAEDYMNSHKLQWKNPQLRALVKSIKENLYSFSTNFEVLDMKAYRSKENMKFVHHMIESNKIYHRRWGDAPIRFLQIQMFYSNAEVLKICEFGYQHSIWAPSPICVNTSKEWTFFDHVKSQFGNPYMD